MSDSLIFNELSLPFQSLQDCELHLPGFFAILHQALDGNLQTLLVDDTVGDNWFNINYFNGFSLSQWLMNTNNDQNTYIQRIMDKTKFPLLQSQEDIELLQLSDYKLKENGQRAKTLGFAVILDIPIISFCSAPLWKQNSIEILHEKIDPLSFELVTTECKTKNIFESEQILEIIESITKERLSSKKYLESLLKEGNKDFPNLIFCSRVLHCFIQSDIDEKLLDSIVDILKRLNTAIANTGNVTDLITHTGLTITGESTTTKNSYKLLAHRRTKLPDGSFYNFDLHIKNFSNAKRMYIHPDFSNSKIFIGYFGNHLPI